MLFFVEFFRWVKVLSWAMAHSKEVKNYRFLLELKKLTEEKILEAKRDTSKTKIVEKLTIQKELLDKIINYVNRK